MLEVKNVLDKLNSAYHLFQDDITKTNEIASKQATQQIKIDEGIEDNKIKASELSKREADVAHIEDAAKTHKEGTNLLAEAGQAKADLQVAIDAHEAKKEKDAQEQKIAWDKIEAENKIAVKQADALKKERIDHNEAVKKFRVEQAVIKKLG